MTDSTYKKAKILTLALFFCVCFILASNMPISCAPDEAMRYSLARFIFNHGYLPEGSEAEIVDTYWGFSYAYYPYLASIISAFFMKIVSLFASTEGALLTAARLTGILSGLGTVAVSFRVGELFFRKKQYALLLGALVGFLPQFVFLCSYQNNDAFAVFTCALIICFWARAIKDGFNYKIYIGLGISCGLCLLSYYNAYVFLLGSVVFYLFQRIKEKDSWSTVIRGGLVILVIAFAIAGWFFIRNAALHNGDFLGFKSTREAGEQYAPEGSKPSERPTPASEHLSFSETFLEPNMFVGETTWLRKTAFSFIGYFGLMTIRMSNSVYLVYLLVFVFGLLPCIISFFKKGRKPSAFPLSLKITFPLMIAVNLFLYMYYAYYSDFQAQGRYMMPSMIPFMLFVVEGWRRVSPSVGTLPARLKASSGIEKINNAATRADRIIPIVVICVYIAVFFISYLGYMLPSSTALPLVQLFPLYNG